jgi:hypothetical protein
MPVGAFFAVNIAGTVARLYLIRRFGDVFEGPLDSIVEWIGDHRAPLLVITVGLTVASFVFESRRGETEVSAIAHIDDELNGAESDLEARDEAAGRPAEPGPEAGPRPPQDTAAAPSDPPPPNPGPSTPGQDP